MDLEVQGAKCKDCKWYIERSSTCSAGYYDYTPKDKPACDQFKEVETCKSSRLEQ